jgi:hypothetical protein
VGAGSPFIRPADFPSGGNANGKAFLIVEGTTYQGTGWICVSPEGSDIIDTNSLTFAQDVSKDVYTSGNGITKTGLQFSVNIQPNSGLQFTGTSPNAALDTLIQSSGGLVKSSSGLAVALADTTLALISSGLKVLGVPALFTIAGSAVSALVTATNLNTLVAGAASFADALHSHSVVAAANDNIGSGTGPSSGTSVALGDAVQWSSTNGVLARCDAASDCSECVGLAVAAVALGATVTYKRLGRLNSAGTGWTAGQPVYINTGGGLTQTITSFPSGSNIVRVGTAINTTDIDIRISDYLVTT